MDMVIEACTEYPKSAALKNAAGIIYARKQLQ